MHFSIVAIISLLLCHRVMSSESTVLQKKTISKGEDILGLFFMETKSYINQSPLWHVTIIGASADQFHQIKSLIEAIPYFVGRDAKEACASAGFSQESLTVYFLVSLEEGYVTQVINSLSNCKKSNFILIFEGIVVSHHAVELLLRPFFEKIANHAVLLHQEKESIKIYGYKIKPDCSRKFELFLDWMPGVRIERMIEWINRFEYNGCPISIGTKHHPPVMYLANDTTETMRMIGGYEANIISTIVQKMNSTPLVKKIRPSDEDRNSKTYSTVTSSVVAGETIIGISQIRATEAVIKVVAVSQAYAQECIIWCVPRITYWKRNIMIYEFSWSTWVLVGLTFLVSFGIEKIVRNSRRLNRGSTNKLGCSRIILDLIGSTLGNPIIYQPLSIGGKLLLITYLCYSMVITTAYKTSLSSILMTENHESSIVRLKGIIKANLTTGGDVFKLAILKDQIEDNKSNQELIKRYVIEPNITKALRRISQKKNFAYLTSLTDLIYHTNLLAKAGEPVSFDVIPRCVAAPGSVVVFPKSSHMTDDINQIIQRLTESGLIQYWMQQNGQRNQGDFGSALSFKMMNTQTEIDKYSREKFHYIFLVYCLALIFCTLIFFGELLVHKFKLTGRI